MRDILGLFFSPDILNAANTCAHRITQPLLFQLARDFSLLLDLGKKPIAKDPDFTPADGLRRVDPLEAGNRFQRVLERSDQPPAASCAMERTSIRWR
jgi:hypothetical protein